MNRTGSPQDRQAAPSAATPPARFLPREAVNQPIYVPRRRLGALEAAAAMAVIVACMVALASMTGLLPASMHRDAPAAAAMAVAPANTVPTAITQAAATSQADSLPRAGAADPADAASAGVGGTAGATGPVNPAPPADGANPAPAPAPANVIGQTAMTGPMPAVPDALTAASAGTAAHAGAGRRHHGAGHAGRQRRGAYATAMNGGAGGQRSGKTREQVIAELMQSKRDGTYPAQSETYR